MVFDIQSDERGVYVPHAPSRSRLSASPPLPPATARDTITPCSGTVHQHSTSRPLSPRYLNLFHSPFSTSIDTWLGATCERRSLMDYDLHEHRHRFAVWAAARAAQRGLTNVAVLRSALEATDLRASLTSPDSLNSTASEYDQRHRRWCISILDHLRRGGVAKAMYGRAAKLVAVYVKVMVVVGPASASSLAAVAHPPIDRLLLQALSKSPDLSATSRRRFAGVAWTQLDEDQYYQLIADLRRVVGSAEPFWILERHWSVTSDRVVDRSE